MKLNGLILRQQFVLQNLKISFGVKATDGDEIRNRKMSIWKIFAKQPKFVQKHQIRNKNTAKLISKNQNFVSLKIRLPKFRLHRYADPRKTSVVAWPVDQLSTPSAPPQSNQVTTPNSLYSIDTIAWKKSPKNRACAIFSIYFPGYRINAI